MPEPPAFNHFNLVVRDIEASVAFYRRLGLKIPDADPAWPNYHRSMGLPGGFDLDFDTIDFTRQWNAGWPPGGGMGVLGFGVESRARVDALHAELVAAGYASQQEPYDAFWGSRYAVVSDPDGNAVGLMSPADADRRGPPPA